MYDIISGILKDKEGGIVFKLFGLCHIVYLVLIFGGIMLVMFMMRNKDEMLKKRTINITVNCAFF